VVAPMGTSSAIACTEAGVPLLKKTYKVVLKMI
jgi:hypothetical protein